MVVGRRSGRRRPVAAPRGKVLYYGGDFLYYGEESGLVALVVGRRPGRRRRLRFIRLGSSGCAGGSGMSGRLRQGKYSLRIGTLSCFTLGLSGTVCVGIGAVAPPGAGGVAPP